MKPTDKYLYVSYVLSIVNAAVLLTYCIIGASRCDPPQEHRKNDITLGNTYLRNTWCVENPNVHEIVSVMYFLGYLIWDTFCCIFMIGDIQSAAS